MVTGDFSNGLATHGSVTDYMTIMIDGKDATANDATTVTRMAMVRCDCSNDSTHGGCGNNDKVLATQGRSERLSLTGVTVSTNNQPNDNSGDNCINQQSTQ